MKLSQTFRILVLSAMTSGFAASSHATITVFGQHDEAHAKGFAGNGQGSNSFDHPFVADVLNTNVLINYSDSCSWQSNSSQAISSLNVRRRLFGSHGMRITGSISAQCLATGLESVSAYADAKHQLAFHIDRSTRYTAVVTLSEGTNVTGVFNLIGPFGFVIGIGAPLGTYTYSGTLIPGDYYIDYYVAGFMSPGGASGAMDVVLEVGKVPNPIGP